jgi:hypothetical protein
MGKSQFKIAADIVVNHCLYNGYKVCTESDYYWAYREFFEALDTKFDSDKFGQYINKRI